MGSSFSGFTYTLSSALKDVAFTPGSHFTVNITLLMGPKISSIFPICVLFARYTGALK